jgi:glucose-6-phosphate dehydrogenase assembly protein OpcA
METPVIIPLPDTTVTKILKALQRAREDGGAVALGRVLTLVITTTADKTERVIAAANEASREHPCASS